MAKRFSAVLFDFDGTLLDTNELIIQTFQTVFDRHFPGQYGREEILPFLGPTLQETFGMLAPDQIEPLSFEYREWNQAHHDAYVKEFPGISEMLEKLQQAGVRIAIVSSKRNEMIERGLPFIAARGAIEVVIGLDDVTYAKPNPEPIRLALERLGVSPQDALMVGDNYHDIVGGQQAGVQTAAVAWSIKGLAYLQQFEPDYVIHQPADLLAIVLGEEA